METVSKRNKAKKTARSYAIFMESWIILNNPGTSLQKAAPPPTTKQKRTVLARQGPHSSFSTHRRKYLQHYDPHHNFFATISKLFSKRFQLAPSLSPVLSGSTCPNLFRFPTFSQLFPNLLSTFSQLSPNLFPTFSQPFRRPSLQTFFSQPFPPFPSFFSTFSQLVPSLFQTLSQPLSKPSSQLCPNMFPTCSQPFFTSFSICSHKKEASACPHQWISAPKMNPPPEKSLVLGIFSTCSLWTLCSLEQSKQFTEKTSFEKARMVI